MGAARRHFRGRRMACAGLDPRIVAINVSPQQLFEGAFVDHVKQALEVTGLPPSALELELTESVFQTGASTIEALAQAARDGRGDCAG